ncbi:hypothetical protein Scep_012900 [Stephania cephalantha]|uniref:tetraacyldisaccharide 4'-kinase n=1 Tax=Stephania cephalantha TaxID=152367 RepID=A0AAP0P6W6_9MAGN
MRCAWAGFAIGCFGPRGDHPPRPPSSAADAASSMEKLRKLVTEIAYTRNPDLSQLQRRLVPLLYIASSLYGTALSMRRRLYHYGLLRSHRLGVPVISVGNLSWGGNGKTPMVGFLAQWFDEIRVSPLILTRLAEYLGPRGDDASPGYAGGDEVKMLERHHVGTSVKIGVGADRAATAACFFERHGCMDYHSVCSGRLCHDLELDASSNSNKIGIVILDDGMQHWSLCRDLEIVMINGVTLWGNNQLIPLGPLRETLSALARADVAVIHNADLVSDKQLKHTELVMRQVKEDLPIYYTRLAPSYFFEVGNCLFKFPLSTIQNMVVLCFSLILETQDLEIIFLQLGPSHVDQLVFSDHHFFQKKDIEKIRERLGNLQDEFGSKPIAVVTEKDYDRDSTVLEHLLLASKFLTSCISMRIVKDNWLEQRPKKKLDHFLWIC